MERGVEAMGEYNKYSIIDIIKETIEVSKMKRLKAGKVEIERKFLMTGFPDNVLELIYKADVQQAYISVEPEIRIRGILYMDGDTDFCKTEKSEGGIARLETEEVLSMGEYNEQIEAIKKLGMEPITKDYRVYNLDGKRILEVSKVDDKFYYGEIEFKSVLQARMWRPDRRLSEYILEDVTDDDRYKMKNYWERTRLQRGVGEASGGEINVGIIE